MSAAVKGEKSPLLGEWGSSGVPHDGPAPAMSDGVFATPDDTPLGTAPRLWDKRFWHLSVIGAFCIVTIGLRINTAKMATVYDPETGKASEDDVMFPKPLFLATTYFLGKLIILPFVQWQPAQWPVRTYILTTVMVILGAVGGVLEYASLLYLPVSVVAMVRVAGLVFFTGFASAYITRKSPMTWQIASAMTIVVAGACVTSVYHASISDFDTGALVGLMLVLLSTCSDALEQVVCEVILQEESVDVDVFTFSGVCGLIGSVVMGLVLCVAQIIPGPDNGVMEDSIGTFSALSTSLVLLLLIIVTVVLCLGEMISAVCVCGWVGVCVCVMVLSLLIIGNRRLVAGRNSLRCACVRACVRACGRERALAAHYRYRRLVSGRNALYR